MKEKVVKTLPKETRVKYVKKARMWCKSYAKNDKHIIEWFKEKPNGL